MALRPRLWPGVPLSRVAIVRLIYKAEPGLSSGAKGCPFPTGKLRRVQLPVPGRTYRVDDATDHETDCDTDSDTKGEANPDVVEGDAESGTAPKEMPNPNPKPTPIPWVLRSEFMA